MHVLATAGHVDHGKSTLVRALTGMEPDRWAEERRRGMTIDLGYAWTTLPSGEVVAFVDVPGHQRFLGNMLAGLGPAPAVVLVVAAAEGWRRQSGEHLAAARALGVDRGLLVVTRADLADPAAALAQARAALRGTGLADVEAVAVSAVTGAGLDDLRAALDRLAAAAPPVDASAPVRLWVDRGFTVRGAGTVVTGTLSAGTLRTGDELALGTRRVAVRGLQSLGVAADAVTAPARVAVNLRGVDKDEVRRGDALLGKGSWTSTQLVDVTCDAAELPEHLVCHVGTAAVAARVRPLGGAHVRLRLASALPLVPGDRIVLREPARQEVLGGATVVDPEPPPLVRRGAATARAQALATDAGAAEELRRAGALPPEELARRGLRAPSEALHLEGLVVDADRWSDWARQLRELVARQRADDPAARGVPEPEAVGALGLPAVLLGRLAAGCGLVREHGRVRDPAADRSLGAAEPAVSAVESRLRETPFLPPDKEEMVQLGLSAKDVAAAEEQGRLVRLTSDLVLLPDGPAQAMRVLAGLRQPFSTSEARQALGTTRRVAVPLLEHLDRRGWTRRVDDTRREVVR